MRSNVGPLKHGFGSRYYNFCVDYHLFYKEHNEIYDWGYIKTVDIAMCPGEHSWVDDFDNVWVLL